MGALSAALLFASTIALGQSGGLIDRPLLLAEGEVRPVVEGAVTHSTVNVLGADGMTLEPQSGDGVTVGAGLDVGISERLQAGLFAVVPFAPGATFGSVVAGIDYAIKEKVAFRLDAGFQRQILRYQLFGIPTYDTFGGVVVGAGFPFKVRLGRSAALFSGSTSARGFGSQPLVAARSTTLYGNTLFTDDILTLGLYPQSGGTLFAGVFHLPIGLLVQATAWLALSVRSGYRLAFAASTEKGAQANVVHFVPVAADIVFSFGKVDLGLTGGMTGTVGGDSDRTFTSVVTVAAWAQARF